MNLLQDLLVLSEASDDLSKLPKDVMQAVKQNIRKGAENLDQKWANALELVHKAYEIEGIQRPSPSMDSAWKQYEENLQYAVQQLASNRGMEDDWRMSSSMFHEALKGQEKFQVTLQENGDRSIYLLEATNINDVISHVRENIGEGDVNVTNQTPTEARIRFAKWGIRRNLRVDIKRVS